MITLWGAGSVTRTNSVKTTGKTKKKEPVIDADITTVEEHHALTLGRPHFVEELIERYALVYGTDTVWDVKLLVPMKYSAFSLHVGRPMAREWQDHPMRRVVSQDQVVFDPTDSCGPYAINLFQGLQMAPVKGNCAELLELLMHLVSESADNDEGIAKVLNFVLDWLAYPLQNPGAKSATALVFHGPQGTGKNLFFEAYARIYGQYATVIGQAQLESRYNDLFSRKLFIIADEVSASYELNHNKNVLKSLITAPVIQIETKFQQTRSEANHCNFVFLSNENRPLALERDDRRHLVVYCPTKRQDGLYERVRAAIDEGAVEAFYEALLARKISNFQAHSAPPMTGAKADLVELGLKPAERFAKEWISKELDLALWPCSKAQLYAAFTRWCRSNGERVPNQSTFSSSVSKFAGPRLSHTKASPSPSEIGAPISLWLPAGTGPMNGVRWYDFAKESVAAFDPPLARFGAATSDARNGGDQ
jgi:putative DNA primase/helicase